ncbi:MAG: hypothetical protein EAZ57_10105 [Cytophagales bacterium]|nr:MAG: hypothetical protein EAZ57_10105 [Cytophagales bacterium]
MALEELMGVVLCGFLAFLAYRLGRSSSLLDLLFHFIFLVLGLVVCQLGLGADVVAFTMLLVFASGILILIALGLHLSPEHPNETVVKLKVWIHLSPPSQQNKLRPKTICMM